MFKNKSRLIKLAIPILALAGIISIVYHYQNGKSSDTANEEVSMTESVKKEIIKEFNENFIVFEKIRYYAEKTTEYTLSDAGIQEELNFLYKDLKYDEVSNYFFDPQCKGVIMFIKGVKTRHEQGIVYFGNGVKEIKTSELLNIKGNWYYYEVRKDPV